MRIRLWTKNRKFIIKYYSLGTNWNDSAWKRKKTYPDSHQISSREPVIVRNLDKWIEIKRISKKKKQENEQNRWRLTTWGMPRLRLASDLVATRFLVRLVKIGRAFTDCFWKWMRVEWPRQLLWCLQVKSRGDQIAVAASIPGAYSVIYSASESDAIG